MSDTEPLDKFKPATKNANRHTPRGLKALADAMGEVGYVAPITAAADGEVLDGSARLETAFDKFGNEAIVIHHTGTKPIIMVRDDIPNAHTPTAKKIAYGANRIAQLDLDFDPIQIAADLEAGIDLSGLWQPEELNAILEAAGTELLGKNGQGQDPGPQIDRAAELQEKWQTAPGQLWQLGRHRLICGDCTDRAVVERVMGGEKTGMVFTDPPYNVGSETSTFAQDAPTHYRTTRVLADTNWDKGFDIRPFLSELLNWLSDDVSVYICTSHHLACDIWQWMKDWARFYSYCVWCKPNPSPSLSKRQWTWATELITYGVRGKHTFNYPDGTHALNWWQITVPRHITDHPTEKPASVPMLAIERSSNTGDIVYDGFLGSGTTLIACENLNRQCRAVEIDPGYCAVAIQRWVDLTGQSPQLLEG